MRLSSGIQFGFSSGASVSTALDTILRRDAANTLALKNSTNAQEYRVYNSDSTDDEFVSLGFINNSNVFGIETEATGAGTIRPIALLGGNVGIGTTSPGSILSVEGVGNFQAGTSTIYTGVNAPGFLATSSGLTISGGSILQTNNATNTLAGGVRITGGNLQVSTLTGCNGASVLETDTNGNLQCGSDAGASGVVTSVSNSDSTLTISPTAGDVVASLNLTNPNTWTGLQQFSQASATQLTIGFVNATSSATSTFVGGISAGGLSSF